MTCWVIERVPLHSQRHWRPIGDSLTKLAGIASTVCIPCVKGPKAVQAAKASGNLDLEKLLDMKEAGIEVESFVSEEMRLQMYQKEVRTQSPPC